MAWVSKHSDYFLAGLGTLLDFNSMVAFCVEAKRSIQTLSFAMWTTCKPNISDLELSARQIPSSTNPSRRTLIPSYGPRIALATMILATISCANPQASTTQGFQDPKTSPAEPSSSDPQRPNNQRAEPNSEQPALRKRLGQSPGESTRELSNTESYANPTPPTNSISAPSAPMYAPEVTTQIPTRISQPVSAPIETKTQAPYDGPSSGRFSYDGPPVPQNGEIVFRGLPPGRIRVILDERIWSYRLAPAAEGRQQLILRSKRTGVQKNAEVTWLLDQ